MFIAFCRKLMPAAACAVAIWAFGCEEVTKSESKTFPVVSNLQSPADESESRGPGEGQESNPPVPAATDFVPIFAKLSSPELAVVRRGLRPGQWETFRCCRDCLEQCAQAVGACAEDSACANGVVDGGRSRLCQGAGAGKTLSAVGCADFVEETLGRFARK